LTDQAKAMLKEAGLAHITGLENAQAFGALSTPKYRLN
jgi:hypothetical protein